MNFKDAFLQSRSPAPPLFSTKRTGHAGRKALAARMALAFKRFP
jgi:hypothetical protein